MSDTVAANDGTVLAYEKRGRKGPTVVLLHGWSGSRHYFTHAFDSLAHSCQVYALDLRHHGDSGRPAFGYHVARFGADLNDFLTALDLKDVYAVGTSMGAAVIWSYIENYRTSRLAGAIFVDQAPLQYTASDWKLGSKGCYDPASLAVLQHSLKADFKGFAAGNGECCLSQPQPASVLDALAEETLRCDPETLGRIMADHTQLDWRPILPTIDIPCLNLVGRLSGVFPWEGCAVVGRMIPDCKTVFFEKANHWLYIEEPKTFVDVVKRFIDPETRASIVHESCV
mmetsp:Transcript_40640/g.102201  ORF Transcript_40640/g.102201 Transcript_40640/m.102201 type:complete len:284 (-) Transcript_40640:157-1008(-)